MIKIVGFQHKEGQFKDDATKRDIVYNNITFFYVSDFVKNVIGFSVGELKIAFDQCKAITGYDYAELPEIVNREVELSYIPVGKYQQLSSIRVLPEQTKK